MSGVLLDDISTQLTQGAPHFAVVFLKLQHALEILDCLFGK